MKDKIKTLHDSIFIDVELFVTQQKELKKADVYFKVILKLLDKLSFIDYAYITDILAILNSRQATLESAFHCSNDFIKNIIPILTKIEGKIKGRVEENT